jgi:hypothetical protein
MVLKRPDLGYEAAGLTADHNCYVLRAWHRTENAAPDTDSSTTVEDVATTVDEAYALLRDKVLPTALTLAKAGAATFSDADGETQLVLLEHDPFAGPLVEDVMDQMKKKKCRKRKREAEMTPEEKEEEEKEEAEKKAGKGAKKEKRKRLSELVAKKRRYAAKKEAAPDGVHPSREPANALYAATKLAAPDGVHPNCRRVYELQQQNGKAYAATRLAKHAMNKKENGGVHSQVALDNVLQATKNDHGYDHLKVNGRKFMPRFPLTVCFGKHITVSVRNCSEYTNPHFAALVANSVLRRIGTAFYDQEVASAWIYNDVDTQTSKLLSAEDTKALKSRAEEEVAARWGEVRTQLEENRQCPSLQAGVEQRLAKQLAKQLKKAAKELEKQQRKEARELVRSVLLYVLRAGLTAVTLACCAITSAVLERNKIPTDLH